MRYFTNAQLTCVDTFEGADEHNKSNDNFTSTEETFDDNLKEFSIRKWKGSSLKFFATMQGNPDRFDIIYIDGSHHSDDVIVDAFKAFEMLTLGGIIIFDDYFWTWYQNTSDNPAGAINAFLRLISKQIEIVSFDYQLISEKDR